MLRNSFSFLKQITKLNAGIIYGGKCNFSKYAKKEKEELKKIEKEFNEISKDIVFKKSEEDELIDSRMRLRFIPPTNNKLTLITLRTAYINYLTSQIHQCKFFLKFHDHEQVTLFELIFDFHFGRH